MTREEAIKVIEIVEKRFITLDKEERQALKMAIKALSAETSKDSISRKGKWLHPYRSDIACECSVCHIQMPITDDFHYCPNCRTPMTESEESDANSN